MEDVGSEKPPPQAGLVKGQEVSLGCGTLILIAVIVMIFSKSNRDDRSAIAPVLQKLDAIEKRLDVIERRLETPQVRVRSG